MISINDFFVYGVVILFLGFSDDKIVNFGFLVIFLGGKFKVKSWLILFMYKFSFVNVFCFVIL